MSLARRLGAVEVREGVCCEDGAECGTRGALRWRGHGVGQIERARAERHQAERESAAARVERVRWQQARAVCRSEQMLLLRTEGERAY